MTASRVARVGTRAAAHLPVGLAVGAGAAEGLVAHRLGRRGPSAEVVGERLGLDPAAARRAARSMAANAARTRNLRIAWRGGVPTGHPIARPLPDSRHDWDRGAVLFVPMPWGPWLGAVARVPELRPDVAVLADLAPETAARWGLEVRRSGTTTVDAAASLKWGVDRLAAGSALAVPLIGNAPHGVAIDALGQQLTVPRGIALLARRTGAPVVPVTTAWRGGRIDTEVHPPVAPPEQDPRNAAAWDAALLRALVAAMEDLVHRDPTSVDPRVLSVGQASTTTSS